ncbi:hydrogen gas-evolving membrane-bound hydrogenase subunit E [Halomarina rubra]|uniref:Hydrogen gas-evolving membrane-bound hydrogenase subunit E n=1 Tax=Halomarina rubra TaxID=2071873 RepID=A0ABD6ARP5_9EURY
MQPEPAVLFAVLALPFVGAALTPLVYRVLGERTAYFAAAVATACLALVLTQYGTHGTVSVEWIPQLGVNLVLYMDGLAFLVALLASGVGVLVFTYSGGYMHGEPGQDKYYTTLLVFMGAMLGVALAADLVALFVFWELTSVSSFLLIGHYQREASSIYASRKSMLITVAGGLFMLVGFLFLHDVTGSFALFDSGASQGIITNAEMVREELSAQGLLLPVVALVALGAATKSAQVPFHIWLPNAMEAPTPVSAFLHSATMVKAGVYLVGRFRPLFVPEEVYIAEVWTPLLVGLGLLTMTVAAMLAVSATDIKELLAYSTASHLGLIVAGFGFAVSYGGEAGAFHILNHASFKAALFLVAGIVAHEAGTRDIGSLSGLRDDLPITAAIATVACLSMAGIPPFNGFFSKELLFEAAWETGAHFGGLWYLVPAVAVFGSVFTFLYSIKFLSLFYGDRPDGLGEVHSPPLAMVAPAAVLGLAVVVISLVPNLAIEYVAGLAYEGVAPGDAHSFTVPWPIPTEVTPYALMSLVTIVLGAALFPFYDRLHGAIGRARRFPYTSPNAYYDGGLAALERASGFVPAYVQTRMFRTYAASTLLAVCALALGGYLVAGTPIPPFGGLDSLTLLGVVGGIPLLVILLVALFGAAAVGIADSHVAGVLTLSILGFMVAIFYVLASAPDLALTQLVIETLVLLIFLLVLDKLPTWYGDLEVREAIPDAIVAGVVGVTVTLTVLVTTSAQPSQNIASFFVENAPIPGEHDPVLIDAGGGGNIVNVILVDFRAFDTLGEITVVAMAALAVLTLVGMRNRGEDV